MHQPLRLALIGVGKIARDQHLPAIGGDERFILVATVDPKGGVAGTINFESLEGLMAAGIGVDAVSLATPAAGRHALVVQAVAAGYHVMLEKPPAATLSEVDDLRATAEKAGRVLFASWHSRAAPFVAAARAWLAERVIRDVRIVWREDVRRWHPGQEWLFGPGGFGCFDPGINALSIATHILPDPLFVTAAELSVPEGRDQPIAAMLSIRTGKAGGAADFDMRQEGPQTWDIAVDTYAGLLTLREGGAVIEWPDAPPERAPAHEYSALYAQFAVLIDAGRSDVDVGPLRLVADALLVGRRVTVAPFAF